MGSRRKAQQYEQQPQLQRPMRSSDSPARTMIRGRSQTSRGSITLTSLKQFSLTSLASYLVGTKIHTRAIRIKHGLLINCGFCVFQVQQQKSSSLNQSYRFQNCHIFGESLLFCYLWPLCVFVYLREIKGTINTRSPPEWS